MRGAAHRGRGGSRAGNVPGRVSGDRHHGPGQYLLDRNVLLASLNQSKPGAVVTSIMRDPAVVASNVTRGEALAEMHQRRLKSWVIVDGYGHFAGVRAIQ